MRKLVILVAFLLVASLAWADSDTINPVPVAGSSTYDSDMSTFLKKEEANRDVEWGWVNFVSAGCVAAVPNPPGLNMTPYPCIAYNAGYRGTEIGSITLPDNSTCWVAMDENTAFSNPLMPNFGRQGNTHYLVDCIDATAPTLPCDAQYLMKVTTLAGAIVTIVDLRNISPFPTPVPTATPSVLNVGNFGPISGSSTHTTGSIAASSTTLTVASATDWKVGMGIAVAHAGAIPSMTTEPTPVASPSTPTPIPTGAVTYVPTPTPVPSPTATSYVYCMAPYYGNLSWGPAVCAAPITNSSYLTPTGYSNTVSKPGTAGVWSYLTYRNGTIIGNAVNTQNKAYAGLGPNTVALTVMFRDYGQSYSAGQLPATPPSQASAANLSTHVVTCGASTQVGAACTSPTFMLAAPAGTGVSGAIVAHDDCNLGQQALNTVNPTFGAEVVFPGAVYNCASTMQYGAVGQNAALGLNAHGGGVINTQIVADDLNAGGAMIRYENVSFSNWQGMQCIGNATNPLLACLQSDIDDPTGGPGIGNDSWKDIFCGGGESAGMAFCFVTSAAPQWDQNNASHLLDNVYSNGSVYDSSVYFGHLNSLENKIQGCSLNGGMYTIRFSGGSATVTNTEMNATHDDGSFLIYKGPGTYTHDSVYTSISSETPSNWIYIDAQAIKPLSPYPHAADRWSGADIEGTGSPGEAEVISQRSKSIDLVLDNVRGAGNSRPHYTFNNARITNSTMGCGYILYDSQVVTHETNWNCSLSPHTGFAPVNAGNGGWVEYNDFNNTQTNKAFTIPGADSFDQNLVGFDIYGITGNGAVPAASIRILFNEEAAEFLTTGANLSYTNSGTVAPPTLGTCVGGTITSGSTNVSGEVDGVTGSVCTIVFNPASPFSAGVRCQMTDISGGGRVLWPSSENPVQFVVAGTTSTTSFIYHCDGF